MHPKTCFIIFSIIAVVFLFACIGHSNKGASDKFWLDTTAYPKKKFYKVELLTLDGSVEERGIYTEMPIHFGRFFVDTLGKPIHDFYKKYVLDSLQTAQLEKFLVESPCFDSMFLDKTCWPAYRDVFIFYDKNDNPIAAAHICFDCEMAGFYPWADYMCNFQNTVNFRALKQFTDTIKSSK